jgi:hypothetical protein
MLDRLKAAIANVLGRLRGGGSGTSPTRQPEPDAQQDIKFEPINPKVAVSAEEDRLLCPVTRRQLRPGDRIFQCRACRTAYSKEGWDFLKQVDRGRCCGCANRKTVFPLD